MADEVKQLLVAVDASVALLRQNLLKGDQVVEQSRGKWQDAMDRVDRRFANVGSTLTGAVAKVRTEMGGMSTAVIAQQKRIEASLDGIRSKLLASASGIAAAFGANELKDLSDGYTRFTNQLKVAGLEGSNLTGVQDRLFATAQRFGAPLEAIGTLYGRAAQAGKQLGASQTQLLDFTTAVGAALKVQGGSAAEAQGALLQLSQALGSGTVHAEEFNSVNEGLRPILQAAADASDKYRGSVAAMRADVVAGKLASKDFFDLILAGLPALERRAQTASSTVGGSLTVLQNALSKEVGQFAESSGASEAAAQGIKSLANNLDTLIPALVGVAAAYGTLKGAPLVFNAMVASLSATRGISAELATEVLKGNAVIVDKAALEARAATAAREAATVEVAAIEETVAARRQDALQLEANLALIREQRAEAIQSRAAINSSYGLGFGTIGQGGATRSGASIDAGRSLQAEQATKAALAETNQALAVSETELAAAKARVTAATVTETAAIEAETFAARAAAAATSVMNVAFNAIGGWVGVAAIGVFALVEAILHFRSEAAETNQEIAAFNEHVRQGEAHLRAQAAAGHAAAGGISAAGSSAAVATGKMRAFAGATGEAADQLFRLAQERRRAAVTQFAQDYSNAQGDERAAAARIAGRHYSVKGESFSSDPRADEADRAILARSRADQARYFAAGVQAARQPLESRLSSSETNGGRDILGQLAQARRDLAIATARGDKSTVNDQRSKVYELTQYQGYKKLGYSNDVAAQRASTDAAALKSAGEAKIADQDRAKSARSAASEKSKQAAEARKAAAAEKDAAGDARYFEAAVRTANDQIASAKAELANSPEAKADIERARIDADRASKDAELDEQVRQGRLGASRAESVARANVLKGLNAQAADLQKQVIDQREKERKRKDALDVATAGIGNQQDLLHAQESLATTTQQRKDIELRLLDLQFEEERVKLEGVRASTQSSAAEKQIAEERLKLLPQLKALAQQGVDRQNQGPLGAYRQQLQDATGDMNKALEGVEVDGLKGLEDGLTGIITGTESVAGAFKKMATSIIADLIRIGIERAILGSIGGSGGGGGGGIFGFIGGLFGGGKAGGGDIDPRKFYVVGEDGPELFAPGVSGTVISNQNLRAPSIPSLAGLGNSAQREVIVVRVDKTPLFDTYIDRRVAPSAERAAYAGAAGGQRLAVRYIDDRRAAELPQ